MTESRQELAERFNKLTEEKIAVHEEHGKLLDRYFPVQHNLPIRWPEMITEAVMQQFEEVELRQRKLDQEWHELAARLIGYGGGG